MNPNYVQFGYKWPKMSSPFWNEFNCINCEESRLKMKSESHKTISWQLNFWILHIGINISVRNRRQLNQINRCILFVYSIMNGILLVLLWKNTFCEIEIVWAPQFQFKFIIKSMETCLSYTLLNVITSGDQLAINVILILIIFSRPISLQFLHWGKEEVALKMVNIVVSAKCLDIPLSNYLYSLLKLFMGPFRTAGRSMRPRKWSNSCPAKEKSCEYLIRSIG